MNNSSTVDVFGSVSVMKSHMSVLLVKLQLLSCVLLVCVCVCVCEGVQLVLAPGKVRIATIVPYCCLDDLPT